MDQAKSVVSRRGIIHAGLVAGVGLATGAGRAAESAPAAGKSLRLAHLTDMHVINSATRSEDGYAMALQSLSKLDRVPDLLVTGGDHVMDALAKRRDSVDAQWDLYQKVLKANNTLPVRPVVGNHDVFGWGDTKLIPPDSDGFGKKIYLERMKLDRTYYSFDAGGWHFICLDNVSQRENGGYIAMLDPEQDAWLKADLEKAGKATPICVISHIPLVAVCTYFFSPFKGPGYNVSSALMHQDVKPLLTLLRKYNTRLCISGHIHMVDRIEYLGITFICDGAVSGSWWHGPQQEFSEGYGVFDFHPDGAFEHKYHTYGWVAKK